MKRLSTVTRPVVLAVLSFHLAASGAYDATPVTAAERPNIVLILADDMGYGDVQVLNPESKIATPHLNALAGQGLVFSDGHTPSAVCTPTRYGLLTGRYCWRTSLKRGVLGGYSLPLLEPGRKTLGDLCRSAGYQTAAIGKWHLGMKLPMHAENASVTQWDGDPGVDFSGVITDSPVHHGFDTYFGVSASLDMAPYVYIRNDRFDSLPTLQQPAVPFPHFIRKGPRSDDFVVNEVLDRLTSEAMTRIDEMAKEEKPFFLYLALTAPHKPTQPHPRFQGKTGLGEYGDFVAQVDWSVGQVLEKLESLQLTDETLVIYTSDNGSYMYRFDNPSQPDHVDDSKHQGFRPEHHRANGELRGTKADIWEAGHRVPLFVRWPQQIPAGRRCEQTVCLTDIYATLAELLEIELSKDEAEDSCSLIPLVTGEVTQRLAPVIHHSVNGMFAIREGRWKLVAGNGSGGRERPVGKPFEPPYQLYDLSSDRSESHDLASEQPELVERLSEKIDQIRNAGRSVEH